MKTFHDYVLEQAEDEDLNGFLKNHGLDDDWKSYKKKPKPIDVPAENPKGWKLSPNETLRDINRIIKDTVDSSTKVNKFGIEDISFEIINSTETSTGAKINMEAHGIANARNSDHIKKQLEKTLTAAKAPLTEKGIHIEILYNKIDTNDSMEEANLDEPAIGLVRKIDFRVTCVAIVNSAKHRNI